MADLVQDGRVRRALRFVIPGMPDLAFIPVFLLTITLGGQLASRDGDVGWHLAAGRLILDQGELPIAETFSYTAAGRKLVHSEWLGQLVLAGTERLAGFVGIAVLIGSLVALPWAVLARTLLRNGGRPVLVLPLAVVGATASAAHWSFRPQVISWLFAALFLITLDSHRHHSRRTIWVLVPLLMIWSWTHGGFLIGLVILLVAASGAFLERDRERGRHLAAVLILGGLATLVNPQGWRLHAHLFRVLGESAFIDLIAEYASPDFHNPLSWPLLALLAACAWFLHRMSLTDRLMVTVLGGLSLYVSRNAPFFAAAAVLALGGAIPGLAPDRSAAGYRTLHRQVAGGLLSALVILGTGWSLRGENGRFGFSAAVFPVAAAAKLADTPPGTRVFNDYVWGGYLIYCCADSIPVYIDGRTDLYGAEAFLDYREAIRGLPGWDRVLTEAGVDWALIRSDSALAQLLSTDAAWEPAYEDHLAVAYRRLP